MWDAITSCDRSLGRVEPRRGTLDPKISWQLHPDDVATLVRALYVLAEIFFAAGAKRILPGVHGMPDVLHSLEEAEALLRSPPRAKDLLVGGNHAFCTTRIHRDPDRGVVDEL